jgi:hypothetical protein
MPPSLNILKNFLPLLEAVELCVPNRLFTPALVLTYCGIDSAAWVNGDKPTVDRNDFMKWVRDYLLPAKSLRCSAEDLYSARCGLLHNLSSDSGMTRSGAAQVIWYAWRPAPLTALQKVAAFPHAPNPIAMYGDDLVEGFSLGLAALEAKLTQAAAGNAALLAWQTQAKEKAGLVLANVPWSPK